ncbi:SIMPL domain-containing protein [Sphingomonas sp. 28-62-11]|uniref:SIMPL domain-containing protein n=1 Tax=Sphingomonas sp. 28-62-11 TaxID=1970432 RepID=UPI0035A94DFC
MMRMLILVALAAALPLAPAGAQSIAPTILADGTILDVIATGETTRVPDLATIRAGVVTQAPTAAAALAENARRMSSVLAALKKAGVLPRDMMTTAATLSPQYRYADNQPPAITGYQATNMVSIRFRDVAASGPVLDVLVAQGANQIEGPTLSLAQPDAAMDDARTDAVKRARERAMLYARAADLTVSRIVSISEAGDQSTAPEPMMYARAKDASASTTIVPGESRVTATLSVRFLLK